MKLNTEQLSSHFKKGLAPLYIVSGDEPFLVQEACDAIRAQMRDNDFSSREILNVDKSFDWNQLLMLGNSLSLFAERKLIELRIPSGKPGDAGRKALAEYIANPPEDTVLLIIMGKLDKSALSTKWFKALEAVGVFIQIWPVDARQLPGWVMQRVNKKGMKLGHDAVQVLAERVEGNLLAAMQELEKLFLLYGTENISVDDVMCAVADSARFNVFGLVDSALEGDSTRTVRILNGLRSEGVEPVLILWALSREIRGLVGMADEIRSGVGMDQAMRQHGIWQKRQVLVQYGLKRFNAGQWQRLLAFTGRIDRICKGMMAGNVWDELLQLVVLMTGKRLMQGAI
ncbi:MAG: DNA polymerase III subunit delta [Gammaproteobacteria bacterium]|nr:DNA polymerase III subunit delta [Gammaproteobacteria bacterium]